MHMLLPTLEARDMNVSSHHLLEKLDLERKLPSLFVEPALTSYSTAEIVANSPQFRRKSSIFVDAIHDLPEKADLAPAQLYSTESGRLFHSGRIVIITVGLPARGKTYDDSPNCDRPCSRN